MSETYEHNAPTPLREITFLRRAVRKVIVSAKVEEIKGREVSLPQSQVLIPGWFYFV